MSIVFGTQDAGPARYLAELIPSLPGEPVALAGPVSGPVFRTSGIPCSIAEPRAGDADFDRLLNSKHPDLVVAGTGWADAMDKHLVRWATAREIPTVAVIDHWSWYRERFLLESEMVLPQHIIINDETAEREARASGLPPERLHPLGNPVLERQAGRRLEPLPRRDWLTSLGLPDKEIVTFVSERLRDDPPPPGAQPLGYDEFEVLDGIRSAADARHHILVKLHPKDDADKFSGRDGLTSVRETHFDSMIAHSRHIVGMGSMLLLEAALHRTDTISFLPGGRGRFIGNELGATTPVGDRAALQAAFLRSPRAAHPDFGRRFDGSRDRIAGFLRSLLR